MNTENQDLVSKLLAEQETREKSLATLAGNAQLLVESASDYGVALKAAKESGWPASALKQFPDLSTSVRSLVARAKKTRFTFNASASARNDEPVSRDRTRFIERLSALLVEEATKVINTDGGQEEAYSKAMVMELGRLIQLETRGILNGNPEDVQRKVRDEWAQAAVEFPAGSEWVYLGSAILDRKKEIIQAEHDH